MHELDKTLEAESGHTPGPWACGKNPVFGSWYVRQDPVNWDGKGYQHICETPADKKGTHYGDMFAANARLIAAAPELQAALKAMLEMFAARPDMMRALRPLMGPAEIVTFDAARAAVVKAKGSSNE